MRPDTCQHPTARDDYNRGLPPDQQIKADDYQFYRAPNNEARVDLMARDNLTAADVAPELRIQCSDGTAAKVQLDAEGKLVKVDTGRAPRGNDDVAALQKLADDAWNRSTATDPQARADEAIAAVRAGAKPPITSAAGNDGTVAVIIGKDGKPYVGVNSHNLYDPALALQQRTGLSHERGPAARDSVPCRSQRANERRSSRTD